jgi:hypothetical protein
MFNVWLSRSMKKPKRLSTHRTRLDEEEGHEQSSLYCADVQRLRDENAALKAERDRILEAVARFAGELDKIRRAPPPQSDRKDLPCDAKEEAPVVAWLRGLT